RTKASCDSTCWPTRGRLSGALYRHVCAASWMLETRFSLRLVKAKSGLILALLVLGVLIVVLVVAGLRYGHSSEVTIRWTSALPTADDQSLAVHYPQPCHGLFRTELAEDSLHVRIRLVAREVNGPSHCLGGSGTEQIVTIPLRRPLGKRAVVP